MKKEHEKVMKIKSSSRKTHMVTHVYYLLYLNFCKPQLNQPYDLPRNGKETT